MQMGRSNGIVYRVRKRYCSFKKELGTQNDLKCHFDPFFGVEIFWVMEANTDSAPFISLKVYDKSTTMNITMTHVKETRIVFSRVDT